jgi:predicted metalloprotease with PDZ domain
MFTQGELVGAMLDLMIRDGSRGRRSLDDVVRALATHFTPARGFTETDVEVGVGRACACDAHPFFETYVRNAAALDFDRWLAVIGLRTVITSTPARSADGAPMPDARMSAYLPPGEVHPRLQIWFPSTAWGRAGLHTGDVLTSWNGTSINDVSQLRTAISQLRIGDTVRVAVKRSLEDFATTVTVAGFDRPTVRLEERSDATDAQRGLRARWLLGK